MDRIFITNLQVETIIGIYDWERTTRQRVVLDLEMSADIAKAAQTENVESTLNYKVLSDQLINFIENSEFQLVETLAERVTEIIRNDFCVQWVKLTLHKPDALAGNTDVGVIIERGERPHA
ncbi:dihydroneopterin aldolase [Granulosicoccus antarcticus]|uniref:7,8-dihydroneopterin aldolase n=1 Tax=Granulosicoccus antarcticus IMCC3135 TaxID=1192854 RepID=A0A2Z2NIL4_9GAMM|nr:dihydroneopterin aldolase [Granulosicoccus antarcticus]ASJ71176.1 Dihydroneopterin aldolase [Granulosicoccus antarcticus IMCC3135]